MILPKHNMIKQGICVTIKYMIIHDTIKYKIFLQHTVYLQNKVLHCHHVSSTELSFMRYVIKHNKNPIILLLGLELELAN